jgi:hypothetical protein
MSPLAVVARQPNCLNYFVVGTDGHMYHKWYWNNQWGPSISGWGFMGGLAAALLLLRLGGLNASTSWSVGLIIRCTKNGGITELGVRLTEGLGQNMAEISAVCQL